MTWDLNLSLGGDATTGARDTVSMGGMFAARGQGGNAAGASERPANTANGPRMQTNQLKERFLATPEFADDYEQAYRDLYQAMYGSGAALDALHQATTAATNAAGSASHAAVAEESAKLRDVLTVRSSALADDPVVATTS